MKLKDWAVQAAAEHSSTCDVKPKQKGEEFQEDNLN